DYIFGMTHSHVDAISMLYPEAAHKTFLLREFDETLDSFENDICDPIGGSFETYVSCRDQIEQGIASLLKFLDQTCAAPGANDKPKTLAIAIGSDHAGFKLKQILQEHLERHGLRVSDFGTDSAESTDYPDYAGRVARSVAERRHDFGLLVCGSGIGMSIAANKVPGVRAAVVHNEDMARLARQHNDLNVLCLSERNTPPEEAKKIVDAFLSAQFEGGRHERRVNKLESGGALMDLRLKMVDPEIAHVIDAERQRQNDNIELIASENFTSPAVLEAMGSVLTNKYAEGYPSKRWYGGCECVDVAERLAIDRAKALFGAEHANVQPHSGSSANLAVYMALLQPGDKVLGMDLTHGGHLTHGHKMNFSGKYYEIIPYGVSPENEQIDYDNLEKLALEHKPKMILMGASAYPRIIDFKRGREIADKIGAILMVD